MLGVGSTLVTLKLSNSPNPPKTLGSANVEPHQFADELYFVSGAYYGVQRMQMQPGLNYVTWQNTTGATTTVFGSVEQIQSGMASSTFKLAMFSTSSASLAGSQGTTNVVPHASPFWSATSSSMLMGYFNVATGTQATTTDWYVSKGNYAVQVPPNWYVMGVLQNVDVGCVTTGTSTAPSQPNICEGATSTARGIDPIFWFNTRR